MTHDSMIEVIAAHRDKKEIEYLYKFSASGIWSVMQPSHGAFNFEDFEYRIKPTPLKPREFYIRLDAHGLIPFGGLVVARSEEQIVNYPGWRDGDRILKVIEVLPSKGEEGNKITISDNQVLAWLGQWRDEIPRNAVSSLQDILGVPKY